MVILREATIRFAGYDPDELKLKSGKRICCACNECGRVQWIKKAFYRDLCQSCIKIGYKNPFYNKHHSDETKEKISEKSTGENHWAYGLRGKGTPNYGKHYSDETKAKWSKDRNGEGNEMYGLRGENNPNHGRIISDEEKRNISNSLKGKSKTLEHKINNSCAQQGINREDFIGFIDKSRPHLTPVKSCIQLNTRFEGSEGHHITSNVVIFIPKNLHKSIWHDFKNNTNIKEINNLAFNYLIGDY